MKKIIALVLNLIIITSSLLISSCDSFYPMEPIPSKIWSGLGGTQTITLDSSRKWTAQSQNDWIKVSSIDGYTFTIEVEPYYAGEDREGSVVFRCGKYTQVSHIIQPCIAGNLSVWPRLISFNSDGGESSISIKSNTKWSITTQNQNWLSISESSGIGNKEIIVKAQPNNTTADRKCSVYIDIYGHTDSICVYQNAPLQK